MTEQQQTATDQDQIRQNVRADYAAVVNSDAADNSTSCCGSTDLDTAQAISMNVGYSEQEVNAVPEGANMGLGCGNPQAIANLKAGETVLDLGSGGGFDCFLAAREVGLSGQVIGIDMTPDMISKARENAAAAKFDQVDFRLGEIEHLPVADAQVDVIISNCVINLSPDKGQVFKEAFRVLKVGGRLAISDVVATAILPDELRQDSKLYSGCMAGASLIKDLQHWLAEAGFAQISIEPKDESREFIKEWAAGTQIEDYVVSAVIEAVKPAPQSSCCG